jgi:hypothetical protein
MRSHLCLCVQANAARQRLGKNVPAATNTHTIEEVYGAVSSMLSVSYKIFNM